jgi:hypothetical protein
MAPRKTERYNRLSSRDQNQDYGSALLQDNPDGDGNLPEGNGLDAVMSELSSSLDDENDENDDAGVNLNLVRQNGSGNETDFSEHELQITVDEAIGGWSVSCMVARPEKRESPEGGVYSQ